MIFTIKYLWVKGDTSWQGQIKCIFGSGVQEAVYVHPAMKPLNMVEIHRVLKSDVVKKYSSWMPVVVSGNWAIKY